MRGLIVLSAASLALAFGVGLAEGGEPPWGPWWWPPDVTVTPADPAGIGAITLFGDWPDDGAPEAVSHEVLETRIDVNVEHVAGFLTVITPWSLTEQLGPLPSGTYTIFGSLFVLDDPAKPESRRLEFGPDLLVGNYVVIPEPSTVTLLTMGALVLLAYAWRKRRCR